MTNSGATIRSAYVSGERAVSISASASGSPTQRAISGRQVGGTERANVTRSDCPATETPAAQYWGSLDRQDRAANPP